MFPQVAIYVIFRKLVLVDCFSVKALKALRRMNKERTAVSYTIKDKGKILFPSISFCKMLPFGDYSVAEFDNISLALDTAKNAFTRNLLNKPNVLHFVTHADILILSFPCKTIATGDVIGLLCAFPFIFRDCMLTYDPKEQLIELSLVKVWHYKIAHKIGRTPSNQSVLQTPARQF